MRRSPLLVSVAIGGWLLTTAPVQAHHAFSAEFDVDKPIKLEGTVTKTEWINPHSWIHIAVKKADGQTEMWMIEGGTPNTLMRLGITRDSLPIGTKIVVTGYQARDGGLRANGRNLTYPDGRELFIGGTGPGAPGSADQR